MERRISIISDQRTGHRHHSKSSCGPGVLWDRRFRNFMVMDAKPGRESPNLKQRGLNRQRATARKQSGHFTNGAEWSFAAKQCNSILPWVSSFRHWRLPDPTTADEECDDYRGCFSFHVSSSWLPGQALVAQASVSPPGELAAAWLVIQHAVLQCVRTE